VGSVDYGDDLDAVVEARPAGLVVPKPDSPDVLRDLDGELSALEDRYGLPARGIALMPVASETPVAVATLMDYRNPPPRLGALTWGAEDLAAALGAASNRDAAGEFTFTFRVVRSLALIAAKAAGVAAIETLHADFRDMEGLARAARAAQREGFGGMLAIHPDQVSVINDAFTPSAHDVEHAQRVVAAFADGAGVAALDGRMLDQPHLKQAQHILAVAARLRVG
jgi:citrate lyase subunit beta/citryl-CoA lyase